MYHKGLIYRGNRLVNWDPHFETAISDLEVENIEIDGHFWHFKYPLADGETYTYVEKDEDGAVTVDWVVLTAAIVGLGVTIAAAVASGTLEGKNSITTAIDGVSIGAF